MATLWEQLNRLFPEVLSPEPREAINGTKLLEKVRNCLEGEYSENSIRQHFSEMSQDPTSSNRITVNITLQRISTGKERTSLDWEHIRDLRSLSPEFRLLFEWVAYCLAQKRAYTFMNFNQIQSIEKKTG